MLHSQKSVLNIKYMDYKVKYKYYLRSDSVKRCIVIME
ncbi:hypothetical protein QEW_2754 [Clostridioides difficile CD160]|nr:hypothetical protein QEW_2754 [Clostridioides difficile CD160]